MTEKRVKIIIDQEGNFDIEAVKGFANGECHHTVEAIVAGMNATATDNYSKDDHYEEPNLIASLR